MPSYEGSVRSSSIDRGIAHVPKPKKEILIQTNRTENNTTRHITPLRPVKENKTIKLKNFKSGKSASSVKRLKIKKHLTGIN